MISSVGVIHHPTCENMCQVKNQSDTKGDRCDVLQGSDVGLRCLAAHHHIKPSCAGACHLKLLS